MALRVNPVCSSARCFVVRRSRARLSRSTHFDLFRLMRSFDISVDLANMNQAGTSHIALHELGGSATEQIVLRYPHLAAEHLAVYVGNTKFHSTNMAQAPDFHGTAWLKLVGNWKLLWPGRELDPRHADFQPKKVSIGAY